MNYFLFIQLESGSVHVISLYFQVVLVPGPLLLAQVWMVDVEDQDDPGLVALVVDFMLEAVVKDDHLALLPGKVMLGHSEPGRRVGGDEERQVGPELGVGEATVRPDMRGPGHDGQLDLTGGAGTGLGAEWSSRWPRLIERQYHGWDQDVAITRHGSRLKTPTAT